MSKGTDTRQLGGGNNPSADQGGNIIIITKIRLASNCGCPGGEPYQASAHGVLAPISVHKPTQSLVHSPSMTSTNSAGTSPPKDSCNAMPAYIPCATQPGPQY